VELLHHYDERYLEGVMLFVADRLDVKKHSVEEVIDLFSGFSPTINRSIMTVRQAMEEQSIQKGMQQGLEQGIRATANSMLKHGIDFNLIQKTTGLSRKQLEELGSY